METTMFSMNAATCVLSARPDMTTTLLSTPFMGQGTTVSTPASEFARTAADRLVVIDGHVGDEYSVIGKSLDVARISSGRPPV